MHFVTPRPKSTNPKGKVVSVRIHEQTLANLLEIESRDGVPVAEQVRRGIGLWLESKGVKAASRRAATRRKT